MGLGRRRDGTETESELPVFLSGTEILVSRDSLLQLEMLIEGLVEAFLSLCECECADWPEEGAVVPVEGEEEENVLVLDLCPDDDDDADDEVDDEWGGGSERELLPCGKDSP